MMSKRRPAHVRPRATILSGNYEAARRQAPAGHNTVLDLTGSDDEFTIVYVKRPDEPKPLPPAKKTKTPKPKKAKTPKAPKKIPKYEINSLKIDHPGPKFDYTPAAQKKLVFEIDDETSESVMETGYVASKSPAMRASVLPCYEDIENIFENEFAQGRFRALIYENRIKSHVKNDNNWPEVQGMPPVITVAPTPIKVVAVTVPLNIKQSTDSTGSTEMDFDFGFVHIKTPGSTPQRRDSLSLPNLFTFSPFDVPALPFDRYNTAPAFPSEPMTEEQVIALFSQPN